MNFFEFESHEIVDENFIIKMNVEPIGDKYQYRLIFDDSNSTSQIIGTASNPLFALVRLRNVIVSTMDTLSDCVEMSKAASAQIDAYNDMMIDSGEEENKEDNEEDESDVL
jgi:hypothetical protein